MSKQLIGGRIVDRSTSTASDVADGLIILETVTTATESAPNNLSSVEIEDVNESLHEISEGRGKRFKTADDFLKSLKE